MLPEVIVCACAYFPRFFLTIVIVQNVGNVEPLDARMRNRVSRTFPVLFSNCFFAFFLFFLFCFFSYFLNFFIFFIFPLFFLSFLFFFLYLFFYFFIYIYFFHNTCLTSNILQRSYCVVFLRVHLITQ